MNTKAAVILMLGLLGMPAVFNFTKTMVPTTDRPRWSVVPISRFQNRPFDTFAILLDNATGQVRSLTDGSTDVGPEVSSPQRWKTPAPPAR